MNAVGPVALIAAGIYLGYLTITGRAAAFANFLASGGTSLTSGTAETTTTPNAAQQSGTTTTGTAASGLSAFTTPSFVPIPQLAPGATAQQQQTQQNLIKSQIPLTIDNLLGWGI